MALAAALAGSTVAAPGAAAAQVGEGGPAADCAAGQVKDLAQCLVKSRPPATGGSSSSSTGSGSSTRVAGEAAGAAVEDEAVIVGQTVRADDGVQVTFERNGAAAPATAREKEGVALFLAPRTAPGDGAPAATPGTTADDPAPAAVQAAPQDTLSALGDWQAQGSGCSRQSPAGTVVLMPRPAAAADPGDGSTGYCWLDAITGGKTTAQANGQVSAPLVYLPADAAAQTVRVTVSSDPVPVLSVDIDRRDGAGFQNALATQLPAAMPSYYNVGFAGCGCLLTEAPTIRNVVVATGQTATEAPVLAPTTPTAPTAPTAPATTPVLEEDREVQERADASLGLVKRAKPPTDDLEAGDEVSYDFTVTNTGGTVLTGVAVEDSLIPAVSCPAGDLALNAITTCTGTYRVTEADVDAGRIVNTAKATATRTDDQAEVESGPSTAVVKIRKRPSCHDDGECRPRHKEPCRDLPWYAGGSCDLAFPWHGEHWHNGKPCFKDHHHKTRHHHKHYGHHQHHGHHGHKPRRHAVKHRKAPKKPKIREKAPLL
ncbi:DUF7507 domain-containing protein [Actinocorallia herbida]|uniref:DUF7507 domain-containing protein n=1 Tax=Actinocorallia herbida TaxID=58109 RepID=UPI0011CEAF3C|nr:DUF11 domain-containing protein [Actinocorallia herbida]